MTRLMAMVPSITAGTTPTLQPRIETKRSDAVTFHFMPDRWTLVSVAAAVTASTGRLLAYDSTCPRTFAHTGFAKSMNRWCGYTASTMSMVAVHASRNGLLDFHGRPVNAGRIS